MCVHDHKIHYNWATSSIAPCSCTSVTTLLCSCPHPPPSCSNPLKHPAAISRAHQGFSGDDDWCCNVKNVGLPEYGIYFWNSLDYDVLGMSSLPNLKALLISVCNLFLSRFTFPLKTRHTWVFTNNHVKLIYVIQCGHPKPRSVQAFLSWGMAQP